MKTILNLTSFTCIADDKIIKLIENELPWKNIAVEQPAECDFLFLDESASLGLKQITCEVELKEPVSLNRLSKVFNEKN